MFLANAFSLRLHVVTFLDLQMHFRDIFFAFSFYLCISYMAPICRDLLGQKLECLLHAILRNLLAAFEDATIIPSGSSSSRTNRSPAPRMTHQKFAVSQPLLRQLFLPRSREEEEISSLFASKQAPLC